MKQLYCMAERYILKNKCGSHLFIIKLNFCLILFSLKDFYITYWLIKQHKRQKLGIFFPKISTLSLEISGPSVNISCRAGSEDEIKRPRQLTFSFRLIPVQETSIDSMQFPLWTLYSHTKWRKRDPVKGFIHFKIDDKFILKNPR